MCFHRECLVKKGIMYDLESGLGICNVFDLLEVTSVLCWEFCLLLFCDCVNLLNNYMLAFQ